MEEFLGLAESFRNKRLKIVVNIEIINIKGEVNRGGILINQLIVRIENGLGFAGSFYLYWQFDFPIWLFFVLLLVPDITMVGYALNTKIGAFIYNIGHSFILPIFLLLLYVVFSTDVLLLIALIWSAHIFIDRLFGYGLKYKGDFKETHIQRI